MSNNRSSKPRKTLIEYFGKKLDHQLSASSSSNTISACGLHSSSKRFVFENDDTQSSADINTSYYERDSGLRLPMGAYPADKQDDVRKAYINKVMNIQETSQNRLRLKISLEAVKWLAMQGCAFRGHDESINFINRGNFIELIKFQGRVNEKIGGIVLENTLQNAKYTSLDIQKELLNILANRVQAKIRDEIGDAKFCILVDEILDESNKKQLAIILRYVDLNGFVKERFFEVLSVNDINALTLKNEICNVLTRYAFSLKNLRGQGYDGASNMNGEWNGLQALFLRDCPCAYYIHCFAHRLQLALVAVAKEVHDIWLFFSKLTSIVNFVNNSFKRHYELKSIREAGIGELIAIVELESDIGANQMCILQRSGVARWSSHYRAIGGLIKMFSSVSTLLEKLIEFGLNNNIRGEAKCAYKDLRSFDFVFNLLLLHEILGISDLLCQALQSKSQYILNAMNFVSTTKLLLQELRESKWDSFLKSVVSFCQRYEIEAPDMNARYMEGIRRSYQQKNNITIEHYYHFSIFNAVIDFQLMELSSRFPEQSIQLLTLSMALSPVDGFRLFDVDNICTLAKKFYSQDFSSDDIEDLGRQLNHYKFDVLHSTEFQNISSLSELCKCLVETKRSEYYTLIDKLIRLVLTLPVFTSSTERACSSMKLVKTSLCTEMEDDFLTNCMVIYIEREIASSIDLDSIIDEFEGLKPRRITFT